MTFTRDRSGVLAGQLLQTKLRRPRVPAGLVLRPRLFARLDQGTRGPLTLVCAAAGYGKTTLVSSWIESLAMDNGPVTCEQVAWISLDETDNDLRRFLQYFVAGLRTIFAGACADMLELLRARQDPPLAEVVATLSNDITRLARDFILVLDDYQSIGDPAVSDFLSQLLRHWPEPMHLVLISRQDPLLPLPSLRARGLLTEIRTRDLRFTPDEAAAYLNRALPSPIDPAVGEQLERHVEGWIAGLQLATLWPRFTANPDAALAGLAGSEADFADYLVDEVLVRQPAPIRAFLLQTAFLDHFCAPQCQAVIAGADPAWPAQRCVEWLEHTNLFIVPLDNRKEWYRYHPIFRSVLETQAMTELGPARVADLQRRAAAWCAELGMTDEALRYALAAHDFDVAAGLIEHGLCDVLNREDRPTIERWLRLLPEDTVQARPGLLIMKAWSLHLSWQPEAVAKVLQRIALLLERGSVGTSSADDQQIVRGQMLELSGQEAYFANQFAGSIACCREALALLPAAWSYARSGAMLYLGLAMQAGGQDREAEQLFVEDYQALGNKAGTYGLRLLLGLCLMYNAQAADLERIRQTAERLVEGAEASGLGVMRGWGHYFLGVAHYQRNELAAAGDHFTRLVELRYTANLGALRDGAQCLARMYQSLGRTSEAWQVVEFLGQLDLDNTGHESDLTASVRACLRLLVGDVEDAARWADAFREPVPDRAQIFMYSPHLTKARILIARGAPADLHAALEILAKFYAIAERGHNTRLKIEVLVLRTLAFRGQGKVAEWQEALQTAVNLARPGGWVQPFVDLGTPMREALAELAGQADGRRGRRTSSMPVPSGQTRRRILAAFPGGAAWGTPGAAQAPETSRAPFVVPALAEPLTAREVQVLALLDGPLSLKEIARQLGITHSTVKRHTLNIYGKLAVSKRREAVAKARAFGILSSH